jgi:lysine-N-methylase
MSVPYGERIRESIDYGGEPHFRLSAGDRCPHLSERGLCNIITECGESALCQICSDHPRYRSFYYGVTEIGIGLSCEEASRLVLESENSIGYLVSDSEDFVTAEYRVEYPIDLFAEDDRFVAEEKSRLSYLASDRKLSIDERLFELLPTIPEAEKIKSLLLSLEILDDNWRERIISLSASDFDWNFAEYSNCIERTINAFIFRHINCESFYSPATVAAFAALSAIIVAALSKSREDFADTLRAYSAEVEYSTDNTEKILDFIEENVAL